MFIQTQSAFTQDERIVIAGLADAPVAAEADGILAGTLIETVDGWCPVEALTTGTLVQTLDGGLRPVRAIERTYFDAGTLDRPVPVVHLPGGVLNNCAPLMLLPRQRLLVEHPVIEAVLCRPYALIPATALSGFRGAETRLLDTTLEAVTLAFDEEEVVYANTGALVHCPRADTGARPPAPFFAELDIDQARATLDLIAMDALATDEIAPAA